MSLSERITKYFPLWVVSCSLISLIYPSIFIWFSGDLITYGLAGIMLGMGLTLKISDFREVFKSPLWIIIGLLLQFTIMPLFGWLLGVLFGLPTFFAVGLILVSCCPGGTASNVIVYLSKSNVALSVAMTTFSTIFAIFLTPLLTAYFSGAYLEVDALGLFYSTIKVVLLPVCIGLLLNLTLPRVTKFTRPFSPPIAVILITLIVASIIGQGKEIILSSGLGLIASIMILHLLGFLFGYVFCYVLTRNKIVSKTISVEVGMQNSGLGVVLARENFINPATAIPSAISSLVHSIYGSIFVSLFKEKKNERRF